LLTWLILFCLLCCAAAHVLLQPAILFVGERFDSDQDFKLAKSMLLDMFRGQQVRSDIDCFSVCFITADATCCCYSAGCTPSSLLRHAAGHCAYG
jgi:hypothetical protein